MSFFLVTALLLCIGAVTIPKVTLTPTIRLSSGYDIPVLGLGTFLYQNGAIVIPKSANQERIKTNIDIFDFELSETEMAIMHELNTNIRLVPFSQASHDKHYPFNLEF